jgi:CBS domain containing-hemolysin-like protein
MADPSDSRLPREDGAEEQASLSHQLRTWLRGVLGGRDDESTLRSAVEELIEDAPAGEESLSPGERLLIGNILKLQERVVADVMVPRADIVAVEADITLDELARRFAEDAHSRMPVYRDTLDDSVGMVHIKDVLNAMVSQRPFDLNAIVREVLIVAPSMGVLNLLLQMRQTRRHMALVVDEFGGIDGLVTIEDLVEEIVGEIEDEHDEEAQPRIVPRPDGTLMADARVALEDFEAQVGPVFREDDMEDVETLGGLVFALAGRVPSRGEVLKHPSGLEFEVVDADPRRIKRVKVRNVPSVLSRRAAAGG